MKSFEEAVSIRRTNYTLSKEIQVAPELIVEKIKKMVQEAPSAFNMQSTRVVVALGENHDAIWQITKDILKKIVPAENFAPTEEKLNGFAAAYGTVLFFDETETVEAMQKQFAAYADNFPIWAQQANGMAQFAVWTALSDLGLGANLQHYNPLIDDAVKEKFSVPSTWKLLGQMPFGQPVQGPKDIEKMTIEDRVKVFS